MAEYFNVTTNLGDAEVAAAITNNSKINITHIAFGDGNGSVPTPNKSRTSLVREVHRQPVTKYERHPTNQNWIIVETVIPSDVGGFTIREMGLIGNGKLLSHGSHAPFEKVADPSGVSEYRLKFTQNITDGNVVSITLDDSLIFATQAWVEENYIKRSEIVDNLTTNDELKPVSAKQAKKLQDEKIKIGSCGLASASEVQNNPDTITKNGFYHNTTAQNGMSYAAFAHISHTSNTNFALQIGSSMGGNESTLRFRVKKDGVWSAERFFYHSGNTVPLSNGGTGANDAETARTNLGLGTAATKDVGGNSGNVLAVNYFGVGNGSYAGTDSNPVSGNFNNVASQRGGFGIYDSFSTNKPVDINSSDAGVVINHNGGWVGTLQIVANTYYSTNPKIWCRTTHGSSGNTIGTWRFFRDSLNTTVDSNGFIKVASPIVSLYADRIELNDEAQQQNIVFEKLGVGNYLIKNSTGLSNDGWYVEQPKDANGNIYHAVIYEQLENGDLSIRTYENKLDEVGRIVADIEKPVDVKEGRFIAIRLNELPTDITAPTNPTITDDEGNPAPSKYHILDNGVWVITEDDELRLAQEKCALLPKLSKRQFALYLYDNNMYDQVMQAIEANPRFKIEYDSVSDIERLSPTVSEMTKLLGWTDEQIDEMWTEALTL